MAPAARTCFPFFFTIVCPRRLRLNKSPSRRRCSPPPTIAHYVYWIAIDRATVSRGCGHVTTVVRCRPAARSGSRRARSGRRGAGWRSSPPTIDKKHARQPPFAKRLAEHADGAVRDQHQQHDDIAGEGLVELGAGEFAERGGDRLVVEQADDDFLDDGQDDQQHEE